MRTSTSIIVFFIFLAIPFLSIGQTRKISGTVLSFNKYPLKNITIKAKKAKTETKTNEEGKFEIEVKKNDIIRIKESVFVEYNYKITEKDESLRINLIFENSGRNLDKAAEAGYIAREDLEYGLEHLYQENSVFAHFVDVYDAIKYALPESTIIVENGQKAIQFRGPKTIYGSNAALILVDGVIVEDVSFITPVNIIGISKLGASASALYGARAGNGVISIQTR
jgi:hypothetical protein